MRRTLSIVVAAVLAVAVAATIVATVRGTTKRLVVVKGVVGSQLVSYFADPAVSAEFARHGLKIDVTPAGVREIATTFDLAPFGFAFPDTAPAAAKIMQDRQVTASFVPFTSPVVIATYTPVARVLQAKGVAHQHDGYWTLDMKGYLGVVASSRNEQLRISTADIATSSSAAMYAALASYVENGDRALQTPSAVTAVLNRVSPLFGAAGSTHPSGTVLFEDYLAGGPAAFSTVAIYEAQFLERAARPGGSIKSNMVLMYPDPDIEAKLTLVPLSSAGTTVGTLLTTDAVLQQRAIVHGFRTSSSNAFVANATANHARVPVAVSNVVDPPAFAPLNTLVSELVDFLHHSNVTPPTGTGATGTGKP